MEPYHALRLVGMPINIVYVLRVFSMVETLLLKFLLESTRRPKLAELYVILLVIPKPQNHHMNKHGASVSCDNQYQILNIKNLEIFT
jgi:hypothetical protein